MLVIADLQVYPYRFTRTIRITTSPRLTHNSTSSASCASRPNRDKRMNDDLGRRLWQVIFCTILLLVLVATTVDLFTTCYSLHATEDFLVSRGPEDTQG